MSDRQDLIETACHNACQAMHRESERAHREQRSPEACLILAEYDRLQAAERTHRLRWRLIDLADKARRGELPDAVMEAALAAADAAYAAQEHGDG